MLRFKIHHLLLAVLALALAWPAFAADAPVKEKNKRVVVVQKDGDKDPEVYEMDNNDLNEVDEGEPMHWVMSGRGFLGVTLTELTPELREHFGAPKDAGVMIGHVAPDSPAAKAGLKVGDIITRVDGKDVDSSWALQRSIREKKEGDTASLEILRDGRRDTLKASITERDREQFDLGPLFLRRQGAKGEAEKDVILSLDAQRMAEMAEQLKHSLNTPEFQERIRRSQDLEQRMKELEKKIQELEKKLKDRSATSTPTDHA